VSRVWKERCRKSHRKAAGRKTTKILELWHIDLITPASRKGKRYIFTIVDDYSRVIFVELLKEKRDAAEKLKNLTVERKSIRIKVKSNKIR